MLHLLSWSCNIGRYSEIVIGLLIGEIMLLPFYSSTWLILLTVLVIPVSVQAGEAEGERLFAQCIACHGAKGEGSAAAQAPALAGQDSDYIIRQLNHFKAGVRGAVPSDVLGGQMRAMTAVLNSDQSIADVASYIASLSPVAITVKAEGDLRNGNNVYQGNCGSCHGGKGQGNSALNSPRLAGLDRDYLRRQFDHFRDGLRGGHPDDRFGRQMSMMAKSLSSEKDLDDVIAYIHSQANQ